MEKNIIYWLRKITGAKRRQKEYMSMMQTGGWNERGTDDTLHDYIEWQSRMAKEIIRTVDSLVCSVGFVPEDNELHIYVHNSLCYQSCNSYNFKEWLRDFMQMEKSYVFHGYILHEGICRDMISATSVNQEVSIAVRRQEPQMLLVQATVKSIPGNGSLLDGKVELTAETDRRADLNRYNIGVGRTPKLDNGSVRFNHIAIDDDPESPSFELNKYVSRSHAYIKYGSAGFTLYAERGGTPLHGKHTAVFRNGQQIVLNLPERGVPLKHGDQIVLSKSVILIFEQTI